MSMPSLKLKWTFIYYSVYKNFHANFFKLVPEYRISFLSFNVFLKKSNNIIKSNAFVILNDKMNYSQPNYDFNRTL